MAVKSELARGGQRVRGGGARCRGPTIAADGQPRFSGRSCGATTDAQATVGERIESSWGPPRQRRERRRKAGCPPAKRSPKARWGPWHPARPQAAQSGKEAAGRPRAKGEGRQGAQRPSHAADRRSKAPVYCSAGAIDRRIHNRGHRLVLYGKGVLPFNGVRT